MTAHAVLRSANDSARMITVCVSGEIPVRDEQGCVNDMLIVYSQRAQIVVQSMANKDDIALEELLQGRLSIRTPVCDSLQEGHGCLSCDQNEVF